MCRLDDKHNRLLVSTTHQDYANSPHHLLVLFSCPSARLPEHHFPYNVPNFISLSRLCIRVTQATHEPKIDKKWPCPYLSGRKSCSFRYSGHFNREEIGCNTSQIYKDMFIYAYIELFNLFQYLSGISTLIETALVETEILTNAAVNYTSIVRC